MTDEQIQNLAKPLCELQDEVKTLRAKVEELETARKEARWALECISYEVVQAMTSD